MNKVEKRQVHVESRVVAEFPGALRWVWRRENETDEAFEERKAKLLEEACRNFLEHCRDHRSLDQLYLEVERVTVPRCSGCGADWEVLPQGGVLVCASCCEEAAL